MHAQPQQKRKWCSSWPRGMPPQGLLPLPLPLPLPPPKLAY
jgi:hypothetical protein